MRIVSWNVNSLKARMGRAKSFVARHDPDVLCIQETKMAGGAVPFFAFPEHTIHHHGSGQYNGVAILSKQDPVEVLRGFPGDPCPDQARTIAARFEGGLAAGLPDDTLWVVNNYVVNGKHVEDDAFLVKKDWLAAQRAWLDDAFDPGAAVLMVGDWNITPTSTDSYLGAAADGNVHHTDAERLWLRRMLDWGLTDLHRRKLDGTNLADEELERATYTWWDYRGSGFGQNHGLRIDLALGSAPVAARVHDVWVDREERKKAPGGVEAPEKPSDHAPLVVDLA